MPNTSRSPAVVSMIITLKGVEHRDPTNTNQRGCECRTGYHHRCWSTCLNTTFHRNRIAGRYRRSRHDDAQGSDHRDQHRRLNGHCRQHPLTLSAPWSADQAHHADWPATNPDLSGTCWEASKLVMVYCETQWEEISARGAVKDAGATKEQAEWNSSHRRDDAAFSKLKRDQPCHRAIANIALSPVLSATAPGLKFHRVKILPAKLLKIQRVVSRFSARIIQNF